MVLHCKTLLGVSITVLLLSVIELHFAVGTYFLTWDGVYQEPGSPKLGEYFDVF